MPRPKKNAVEKKVTVGAIVLPITEEQVDRLAQKFDRSRGYIADKLIVRGLAAFNRDGQLDEPIGAANVVPMVRKIGYAKAGAPIQAEPLDEWVEVAPSQIAGARSPFAVGVHGDSMIEDDIWDGDTLLLDESSMDSAVGRIALIETPEGPVVKRFYRKGSTARLVSSNPAYDVQEWPINSVRVVGVMIGCLRTYAAESLPETEAAQSTGRKTAIQSAGYSRYGKRA